MSRSLTKEQSELLDRLRQDRRINWTAADFLCTYDEILSHGFDASCVAGWLADAAVAIDDRDRVIAMHSSGSLLDPEESNGLPGAK